MGVTELQVEGFVFPPTVKPPGSSKTLILGGAGVRGVEKEGKYMKFSSIGVYMEEEALPFLAVKWKGRSVDELTDSTEFFMDIITGPFEKFTRVSFILPLTGPHYSGTVSRNCVKYWEAAGIYTEAEETIIEKFKEVFKDQSFQPGAACLFTQSPSGSFTIAFSEDSSIPEEGFAVIENKALSEGVLETIIGEHGVSPALKRSLAARLSEMLKEFEPKKIVEGNEEYEKIENASRVLIIDS